MAAAASEEAVVRRIWASAAGCGVAAVILACVGVWKVGSSYNSMKVARLAGALTAVLYALVWALGGPGWGSGTAALVAFLAATVAVPLATDARVTSLPAVARIALFPSTWLPPSSLHKSLVAAVAHGVCCSQVPAAAGAALGAVAGASALPLDWGDAWLEYPLPCLAGGVVGWAAGLTIAAALAGIQWMGGGARRAHGG